MNLSLRYEHYVYSVLGLPFRGRECESLSAQESSEKEAFAQGSQANPQPQQTSILAPKFDLSQSEEGVTLGVFYPCHAESISISVVSKYVSYIDRKMSLEQKGTIRWLELLHQRTLSYEEWQRIFEPTHAMTLGLQHGFQYLQLDTPEDVSAFKSYYRNDEKSYLKFIFEESHLPNKAFFFRIMTLSVPIRSFYKHTWLLSKTGIGKSTLISFIAYMLIQHTSYKKDLSKGNAAMVLLDPHADLAHDILQQQWSKASQERLVFFDPVLGKEEIKHAVKEEIQTNNEVKTKVAFPVINAFDIPKSLQQDEEFVSVLANELIEVFNVLLEDEATLSMQMSTILEPVLTTLIQTGGRDLSDVLVFLDDNRNQAWVEKGCQSTNPFHAQFFQYQFYNPEYNRTKLSLLTRLQKLFNKPVFAQSVMGKSTISIQDCIRSGKILVFSFARSGLGKEGVVILSKMYLALVNIYIIQQQKLAPERRKKVFIIADEFQSMITSLFEELLSEGRKFGVSLLLSHQQESQIVDKKLLDSLSSNTSLKIVGNNGVATLKKVSGEIGVPVEQLQQLEDYHFLAKVGIHEPLTLSVPKSFLTKKRYKLSAEKLAERKAWLLYHSGYYTSNPRTHARHTNQATTQEKSMQNTPTQDIPITTADVRDKAHIIQESKGEPATAITPTTPTYEELQQGRHASKPVQPIKPIKKGVKRKHIKTAKGHADTPPPLGSPAFEA